MRQSIIGLTLVFSLFAGLGGLGWYFAKDWIYSKPQYRLSAENIVVSPPPKWIPERFVEDVLQSSELSKTGFLLDETLPQKLAEAFAAHPWVENVEQVIPNYPSGAEVKLSYRVPAALVDIPSRGMFPIDRNGVLLPAEYLKNAISDQRSKHLIIKGIQTTPLGSAGTSWGDPLVQAAAQLASVLNDVAEPLKLRQIIPSMETTPSGGRIECRLKTERGTEITWGSFVPDDPNIEAKKKRLGDLNEQYRSLDNVPSQFRDLGRE